MRREGTIDSVDIYLTETEANLPTDVILGSTEDVDISTITTDANGEDVEFTLDTPIELTSGKYAIYITPHQNWNVLTNMIYFGKVTLVDYDDGSYITNITYDGGETGWLTDSYHLYLNIAGEAYVFTPPADIVTTKRLVAAANDKIWYENI